jgi:hypothetical protein
VICLSIDDGSMLWDKQVDPAPEELAINQLGSEQERFNATPAIVGDQLLIRSDAAMYCIRQRKET